MFRLEDVKKVYTRHGESVTAFECSSLTVTAGEFVAILGPSGSGKTTLLSLLGGMLAPTQGRVWLDDCSVYDQSVAERAKLRRTRLGFVFQTFNLVPYLTALENVQVPLCLAGAPNQKQVAEATALLAQFGLGERLHHKPAELSIGQQQRVALARTMVSNPRIIMADEPTGNLDPASRTLVLDCLSQCNGEGRTIIMVTHDPTAAERAGRVVQLREGKLASEGETLSNRLAA